MNFFFDLDGTLWDSQDRLYSLFCDLVPENSLSRDEYWRLKRMKVSNEEILKTLFHYNRDKITAFTSTWLSLIESSRYLKKDHLFPFTRDVLSFLRSRGHNVFFVTLRQSEEMAEKEIVEKDIARFCVSCLVSNGASTKDQVVRDASISISRDDFFIGDTGVDVMAGKALGMHTIAVLSGFRERTILEGYAPDYIFNDISDIKLMLA
jgi:phosphoglycolate phosphatase